MLPREHYVVMRVEIVPPPGRGDMIAASVSSASQNHPSRTVVRHLLNLNFARSHVSAVQIIDPIAALCFFHPQLERVIDRGTVVL